MSVVVEIMGQKYFASLPTLKDLLNFVAHMKQEHRQAQAAAIPPGLPKEEFDRWRESIEQECSDFDKLEPHQILARIANNPSGAAVFYHSLLRVENPSATLQWVNGILDEAQDGNAAALQSIKSLRLAWQELMVAKKNELQASGKMPADKPKRKRTSKRSSSG